MDMSQQPKCTMYSQKVKTKDVLRAGKLEGLNTEARLQKDMIYLAKAVIYHRSARFIRPEQLPFQ